MRAHSLTLLIVVSCLALVTACDSGDGGDLTGAGGDGSGSATGAETGADETGAGDTGVDETGVDETGDGTSVDETGDDTGVDETGDGGWGQDLCASAIDGISPGFKLTNQLASMTLKNCDGEPVDLLDFCGAKGMWIFLAHGWCPHCKATTWMQEEVHDEWSAQGLATINVLVQTSSYGTPTAQDCKQWALQAGFEDVVALYDDSGTSQVLWESNYTALNVFVNDLQIITSKIHSDVKSQIEQQLTNLLSF